MAWLFVCRSTLVVAQLHVNNTTRPPGPYYTAQEEDRLSCVKVITIRRASVTYVRTTRGHYFAVADRRTQLVMALDTSSITPHPNRKKNNFSISPRRKNNNKQTSNVRCFSNIKKFWPLSDARVEWWWNDYPRTSWKRYELLCNSSPCVIQFLSIFGIDRRRRWRSRPSQQELNVLKQKKMSPIQQKMKTFKKRNKTNREEKKIVSAAAARCGSI